MFTVLTYCITTYNYLSDLERRCSWNNWNLKRIQFQINDTIETMFIFSMN